MAKQNDTGVFQLDNGMWAYRLTFTREGKRYSKQKSKDENGEPLKNKRAAIKARKIALENLEWESIPSPSAPEIKITVADVYVEYCSSGRNDRAYQTIRKQDSLWENHLRQKFGSRIINSISVAEINDYLAELYHVEGYSYQYTESFLKMFYLIFGQAYSRNYLDVDTYNKLCTNKGTKIKMPKMKTEDDTDIVAFSNEELRLFDDYFKGTNAETAYLLGRYCGLRINETFGLKWDHVNLEEGTITIDRQMQYQNGIIKLISPKTRNSKRTVYIPPILTEHLTKKARQRKEDEIQCAALREQNQRMIEDLDGTKIPSTELVNCLYNGKIQTVNSFKYPSREIKSLLGIDFKYHYLRHTYGTRMAEMNTPAHLLCDQMGHGNIHVTQRYYIAISKSGVEILKNNRDREKFCVKAE